MVDTVNFSVPGLSVWQFYVTDHFQGKESKLNIPVVRSWQSPEQWFIDIWCHMNQELHTSLLKRYDMLTLFQTFSRKSRISFSKGRNGC